MVGSILWMRGWAVRDRVCVCVCGGGGGGGTVWGGGVEGWWNCYNCKKREVYCCKWKQQGDVFLAKAKMSCSKIPFLPAVYCWSSFSIKTKSFIIPIIKINVYMSSYPRYFREPLEIFRVDWHVLERSHGSIDITFTLVKGRFRLIDPMGI